MSEFDENGKQIFKHYDLIKDDIRDIWKEEDKDKHTIYPVGPYIRRK